MKTPKERTSISLVFALLASASLGASAGAQSTGTPTADRPSVQVTLDWLQAQGLQLGSPDFGRAATSALRRAGGQYCSEEVWSYVPVQRLTVRACRLVIEAHSPPRRPGTFDFLGETSGRYEIDLAYATANIAAPEPGLASHVQLGVPEMGLLEHCGGTLTYVYDGDHIDCDETHHLDNGTPRVTTSFYLAHIGSVRANSTRIQAALANLISACPRPESHEPF